jgi:hypothetical protein
MEKGKQTSQALYWHMLKFKQQTSSLVVLGA